MNIVEAVWGHDARSVGLRKLMTTVEAKRENESRNMSFQEGQVVVLGQNLT